MLNLIDRFGALPRAGGILDQDAELLRMMKIVTIAEGRDAPAPAR